jgi:hypothetical protein
MKSEPRILAWIIKRGLFSVLAASSIVPLLVYASVNLTITPQANNGVVVAWPSGPSYTLQTNSSLLASNWGVYNGLVVNTNGTNLVSISTPTSSQYFRLSYVSTPGFTDPTNIPGLAYYWNFNDLSISNAVGGWTDRISGVVMTPGRGGNLPTVFNVGVLFNDAPDSLTNMPILIGSNFSFWVVCRPTLFDNNNHTIFGDGLGNGIVVEGNSLGGIWGGNNISSMTLSSPATFQTFDIVDSQGTVYSNGVLMATGIGQPPNNFNFRSLGENLNANDFFGYIQYIGIWTNYALTASDASNLDFWVDNNGVTNVTAGLISWWKLDDGSGTNAVDSSGNTNTLSFDEGEGAAPIWTNGVIGDALYFATPNAGTYSASATLADNLNSFSVSCWLQTPDAANIGHGGFFDKDNFTGGAWLFWLDPGSHPHFGWGDASGNYEETPTFNTMSNGLWHFLSAVKNGTNLWIYDNGVQVSGSQFGTAVFPSTNFSNSGNVTLGYDRYFGPGGSISNYFLDDVRIYNRVLSAQEVGIMYRWRGQP